MFFSFQYSLNLLNLFLYNDFQLIFFGKFYDRIIIFIQINIQINMLYLRIITIEVNTR